MLKKISLSLLSLLITLLFGEIILQIVFFLQNDRWVWDINQTFQLDYIIPTDDYRKYALRPFFYDKIQNMPINQWGERITPQDENPDFLENTIVCLGDSVPFGYGASHWETYPYFLSELLQKDGYPYYVINAGVPSYNARQSFGKLKYEVYSHIPPTDIEIILFQAANDVSLWAYYRENWNEDITWADVRFNIHSFPLVNRSAIFNYIYQLFSPGKGSQSELDEEFLSSQLINLFTTEIEDIHQKSPNTKIILLPINPFYYQLDNTANNENLDRFEKFSADYYMIFVKNLNQIFNQALEEVSEKFDFVFFLDIREAMDKTDRDPFFSDYIHLTGEGAKFQAEKIVDYLMDNNMIRQNVD